MMRSLILIFAMLSLAVSHVEAASSEEERAFTRAKQAFNASAWPRADEEFGAFVATYNASTNVPEAIVLQAQAKMKMNRLTDASDILTAHLNTANGLTVEFLYWLGQINSASQNYSAASTFFGRLANEFPKSSRRLEAAFDEAVCLARIIPAPWPRIVELLSDTNGAFQSAARTSPTNELVYRGELQLGEAQLAMNDFENAEDTLTALAGQKSNATLNWQRQYLLCRVQLANHRPEEALDSAIELRSLASDAVSRSESIALQAKILEQLDRIADAITAYKLNLSENVPVERQQQATFKVAELSMTLGKWDDAIQTLETLTNSKVADVVYFTLGDLRLKKYLEKFSASGAPDDSTNLLRAATQQFRTVLDGFPGSKLVGKALLNMGWSLWYSRDFTNSGNAFQAAAAHLQDSEEEIVAHFKWADTQSQLGDFVSAITNYNFVVNSATKSAEPRTTRLVEPALYQLLRTSLDAGEMKNAIVALTNILESYPNTFIADSSLLLAGQGFALHQDTAKARDLFLKAETNSTLLPEIRLAVARTYEQEQNWSNAISVYDDWMETFTNSPAQPQAEYYRAWANFQSGNETNALALFTRFAGQFPTTTLAVTARWWIGDYYFRNTNYVEAEKNFQNTNLWSSPLAYDALMMAGRSAVARGGYQDAINYFKKIANEATNTELRIKALSAYGDTYVSRDSTNKVDDLETAIGVFGAILSQYGTNLQTVPTLGKIGECYAELAKASPQFFAERATNAFVAYRQLIDSPLASVAARRQAKVEMGDLLEKQAALKSKQEQKDILNRALKEYQDVILEDNGPESGAELFWKKKACQEAARLSESLDQWAQAVHWYKELKRLIPSQTAALDKKIEKIMKEHPEAFTDTDTK